LGVSAEISRVNSERPAVIFETREVEPQSREVYVKSFKIGFEDREADAEIIAGESLARSCSSGGGGAHRREGLSLCFGWVHQVLTEDETQPPRPGLVVR
jgi:hypothetical protein